MISVRLLKRKQLNPLLGKFYLLLCVDFLSMFSYYSNDIIHPQDLRVRDKNMASRAKVICILIDYLRTSLTS